MNWLPIRRKDGTVESRAIVSDCGRYTIAKITTGSDWYECHCQREYIGGSADKEAAKRICAQHAAERRAAA